MIHKDISMIIAFWNSFQTLAKIVDKKWSNKKINWNVLSIQYEIIVTNCVILKKTAMRVQISSYLQVLCVASASSEILPKRREAVLFSLSSLFPEHSSKQMSLRGEERAEVSEGVARASTSELGWLAARNFPRGATWRYLKTTRLSQPTHSTIHPHPRIFTQCWR